MAHTDKTDPFWVRIRTKYYVSEPWHPHLPGEECDLPPLSEWNATTRCTWEFRYDGRNVCACKLCSGIWEWITDSGPHRDRRVSRAQSRRWSAEYNTYGDIQEW